MFRIASWNVNSIKVRLESVTEWLLKNCIDVLALQETKTVDENFPKDIFSSIGYHCSYIGEPKYNGVAIISKHNISNVETSFSDMFNAQKRYISACINGIKIINLYVPNGQSTDSDKYIYKLNWLEELRNKISLEVGNSPNVIVLGDFNIAPKDNDVYDINRWHGKVLVTDKERLAFKNLMQLGLHDTFDELSINEDIKYSWWDYRQFSYANNKGVRIDHILSSSQMIDKCTRCYIDTFPRGQERPSDHAPIIGIFNL